MTATDYWRAVADVLRSTNCRCRVKWSQNSELAQWSPWLIIPSQGYIETFSLGPIPMREVDWVEVDSTEVHELGRLVAPRKIDRTSELIQHLERERVLFQRVDYGFRVLPQAV